MSGGRVSKSEPRPLRCLEWEGAGEGVARLPYRYLVLQRHEGMGEGMREGTGRAWSKMGEDGSRVWVPDGEVDLVASWCALAECW